MTPERLAEIRQRLEDAVRLPGSEAWSLFANDATLAVTELLAEAAALRVSRDWFAERATFFEDSANKLHRQHSRAIATIDALTAALEEHERPDDDTDEVAP